MSSKLFKIIILKYLDLFHFVKKLNYNQTNDHFFKTILLSYSIVLFSDRNQIIPKHYTVCCKTGVVLVTRW